MNTPLPPEVRRLRDGGQTLQVTRREQASGTAEIIYLQRRGPERLPSTNFGSAWYHEAAMAAEDPARKH